MFALGADINGSTEHALEMYTYLERDETPDFEYIRTTLEPVLMCRVAHISARSYVVFVTKRDDALYLHFPVAGQSRQLLMQWLAHYDVPHDFI
jgi:tRNA(Arg) A34 adenosine deaminase TadA